MHLGPVMFDLQGVVLTSEEKEMLQHPACGGIILFTRNYANPSQLYELVQSIREKRPPLLIAVDQEGGRVQRFRTHFTSLPKPRKFGEIYDKDPQAAKIYTETSAWIMAMELRRYDIDFSFAPVLDLDFGHNEVIGDRAFHRLPQVVSILAMHFIRGMQRAGMKAVGKHFPGHGFVDLDSHFDLPCDPRSFRVIKNKDLLPFRRLIQMNLLGAIMPAHIVYEKIDSKPVGFSYRWLHDILREELDFQGLVFSDSLTMLGTEREGGFDERAVKSLEAGCDMILVCNNRLAAWTMLGAAEKFVSAMQSEKLLKMRADSEIKIDTSSDLALREGVTLLEALI